ncbi:MAG TPA: thiamine-phosphate kinase [Terracidiphilus sp.]
MARGSSAAGGRDAELDLLRQIRRRVSTGAAVALGIGDDCALLRIKDREQVAVTTDLSIDGRHFRLGWHPPEAVGHRTLARGLSDLAAMGARPLAAFVSLGLPKDLVQREGRRPAWVSRFYDGLLTLAARHKTPLAGGDLAESPAALADIVLVGAVPRGRALLRSAARAGDAIYVTGTLGGSAAGLDILSKLAKKRGGAPAAIRIPKRTSALLHAHLYPEPRLAQGQWLQRRGLASAAIDLSDGLSTDLTHICEESGLAAEVDSSAIPLGPGATLQQALHGGEDYELLFTARPHLSVPGRLAGVPVTRIGRMALARHNTPLVMLLMDGEARPLEPLGWQHFV